MLSRYFKLNVLFMTCAIFSAVGDGLPQKRATSPQAGGIRRDTQDYVIRSLKLQYENRVLVLEKKLNASSTEYEAVTMNDERYQMVKAVIEDPYFKWSHKRTRGILKKAIEQDPVGYIADLLLKAIPEDEITPGIVEAFCRFLGKDNPVALTYRGDTVIRSKVEVLNALNGEPKILSFHSARITLSKSARPQLWQPVVDLAESENRDLRAAAHGALKRAGFLDVPELKAEAEGEDAD